MLQLFTFMRADLNSYRPPVERSFGYEDAVGSSSNTTEPDFPKSLFLIQPLSSTYELNTVATNAQASVPIPEGLDLEAWIVPPPKETLRQVHESDEVGDIVETKVKKLKKGKGKETGGTTKSKAKKKKDGDGGRDALSPAEEAELTEAERAEQARVRSSFILNRSLSDRPCSNSTFGLSGVFPVESRTIRETKRRSILPHRYPAFKPAGSTRCRLNTGCTARRSTSFVTRYVSSAVHNASIFSCAERAPPVAADAPLLLQIHPNSGKFPYSHAAKQ